MAIEIKNNLNLEIKIKEFTKRTAAELKTALIDAASDIKIRTAQGKEINGSTFKPYSKSYAAKKERQGKQVMPPNLFQTGDMNASAGKVEIYETNGDIYGKIGFTNNDEMLKGQYNQKKRPWFGLSELQKTVIINRLRGK
jgi:hypothetical protein